MEIIHAQFVWVMYLIKEYCAVCFLYLRKKADSECGHLIHGQMFAATLPSRPQAWPCYLHVRKLGGRCRQASRSCHNALDYAMNNNSIYDRQRSLIDINP
ncbi:unnamed protein product [Meganyctiphanes norvegica]|uniref:Uncharacterized protein n=1 Tax=Meganyctiphanes norvegica TaxID=48144 RepID=A0AAV2QL75_MEGNR